jgi:hypothetical protein
VPQLLNSIAERPLQNGLPNLWFLSELLRFLLTQRFITSTFLTMKTLRGFTKSRTFPLVRVNFESSNIRILRRTECNAKAARIGLEA